MNLKDDYDSTEIDSPMITCGILPKVADQYGAKVTQGNLAGR